MAFISGIVTDRHGNPVKRVVRLYRRDTGALLAETRSSENTGAYAFETGHEGEHQVLMLDTATGVTENDMIARVFP